MNREPLILALETSCDETAVAVVRGSKILASEVSSQVALHQPFGGVVPELASRNHLVRISPLVVAAVRKAGVALGEIDAFAATAGPGLASSLLIGNTVAKALALAQHKPFLAINHLEGHLLSPFVDRPEGVAPCVALIVSGGHTILLHLRSVGDYSLLGKTRDDAAGEAFDKVGKMLGLPYPGGPQIDQLAKDGDPTAFSFPRSMLHSGDFMFSFSGLKTAVLYTIEKLSRPLHAALPDLCASFQAAIVEILVTKTVNAARCSGENRIAISGGVACNSALRESFSQVCQVAGLKLLLAPAALTTDNAAMIGYVAALQYAHGFRSRLADDIDPNLALVSSNPDNVPCRSPASSAPCHKSKKC
ncbi:MAG: tRNA (adenosine(37)-N6)-threonylcarbamoyltransferase complex transferase subunit TsaD [Verrucomicrobiales bacterium]